MTQLVDPDRLLAVAYWDGATEREVNAAWCRYVVALDVEGKHAIAMEIAHDAASPAPEVAYWCPAERLTRVVVAPTWVRAIRPYR